MNFFYVHLLSQLVNIVVIMSNRICYQKYVVAISTLSQWHRLTKISNLSNQNSTISYFSGNLDAAATAASIFYLVVAALSSGNPQSFIQQKRSGPFDQWASGFRLLFSPTNKTIFANNRNTQNNESSEQQRERAQTERERWRGNIVSKDETLMAIKRDISKRHF